MESLRPRDHLIDSVIDHCLAFSDHITPLEYKQYATDFPRTLLGQLENLNHAIQKKLKSLKRDPDFQFLSDEEAEEQILRYSKFLYSYLNLAASFIERSDVPHTVVELVQPIKRLMRLQCGLNDFELLLHPLPILNYSFYHLGSELSNIINQLDLRSTGINLPKQLVTIGFPGLETGRVLIHSIIAHELGHCLYVERNLEHQLLPLVRPDAEILNNWVTEWAETSVSSAEETRREQRTLSEVVIRSYITRSFNDITKKWVKELTCDAIGYCLFGPAYLFAALDVLTSAYPFDSDQGTHPPNRMRFLLLYQLLNKETDFLSVVPLKVKGHLNSWESVTNSKSPEFTSPVCDLAGKAILDIYDHIISASKSVAGSVAPYSASDSSSEIQLLSRRAKELKPPNELIEDGISVDAKFQSILNAGWLIYLSGLDNIRRKFKLTPWECKKKFNALIAGAIELNEIQRRWKEVK